MRNNIFLRVISFAVVSSLLLAAFGVSPSAVQAQGRYVIKWADAAAKGWYNPLGEGTQLWTHPNYDFDSEIYKTSFGKRHAGVDIVSEYGQEVTGWEVHAIGDGSVVQVFGSGTYNEAVLIRHDSKEGPFYAVYGHIARASTIEQGSTVSHSQVIGAIRGGGDPDHLHFGVNILDDVYEFIYGEHGWGRVPVETNPEEVGWRDPIKFLESITKAHHLVPVKGIDAGITQVQNIDWEEVYESGYRFAFLKATEGVNWPAPDNRPDLYNTVKENVKGARDAGLLVGVYHFARPIDKDGNPANAAKDEAESFIELAGDYLGAGYLRPVLDVEDNDYGEHPELLGREELAQWIRDWMDTVEERKGVEPILYMNPSLFEFLSESSIVDQYDIWLYESRSTEPSVDDTPNTRGWSTWAFWQYKWNVNLAGGVVDLNVFNGSLAYLHSFLIKPFDAFVPVDLVLVLDRSGSMQGARMQGAKDAAISVVDMLMPHDRVAVVSFASTATTDVQLTSDFEHAKTEIQNMSASGMTSFGAGLKLAVEELKDGSSEDHVPVIIFLSDGHHNTSPAPHAYVEECKNLGIPIYTVGLGAHPGEVGEALLRWMAEETEGEYFFVDDLYDLENVFVSFALEATGWPLVGTFIGAVTEGETVEAGTFGVEPGTEYARVTLNWPGSDLDLIIEGPDGTEVELGTGTDNTYSGEDAKPEWAILLDPEPGTWTVRVCGKVTNPHSDYIVWVSTYVDPTTPLIPSTYEFEYSIPDEITVATDVDIDVTFMTDEEKDVGYDGVRFRFEADGPGDVTFTATDSLGVEHTFMNSGYWGPESGFDLPALYEATTTWMLNFLQKAGNYTITFSLIEAPDGDVIAGITETVTVNVKPLPAAVTIDPETLNLQARAKWITAYIELPEDYDYAAGGIDVNTVRLLYSGNELYADWGDVQDGVFMTKFDWATVAGLFEGLRDEEVELTFAGEIDGVDFEGTDTIRVIDPPRPGRGRTQAYYAYAIPL